ncbi:zinc finger CCCH domain-containing protein 46-like isoform X3 [Salvia splendens]|uniref:zinc finger CCCH domain-containing protein 46-like isoform X3 n=1 Tax=Salvia splendens TaxID=180675 RepID=UPI001C257A24|nr:zinc finger CCCH domain-containing protein 46-like isoform X3 [Salvia splendens]
MPPKKELCRYFQRGSCQYGTRCKFLHTTPQQSQSNPFGFGAQTSRSPNPQPNPFSFGAQTSRTPNPQPNPFGFGVQSSAHSRRGDGFVSKPNQVKPFDNKWSRFSNVNNSSAPASRQANNQPSAANHTCTATDIESCKRVILEDLENEKPLWKLTCYGHSRNGPCDIVGDISYDELRALAYDDAKHGKDIASIVERERNLLNSKLLEFQNLAQNPYPVSSAPTPSSQNMFGGGSTIAPVVNNGFSSQVSSFSQLSGSSNTRSAAAPNFSFGQPNAFQNNTQPSSFQTNNSPFNTPGSFGIQPQHSPQSFSPSGTTSSNNGAISAQQNPFSTPASLPQTGNGAGKQLNFFTNEPISASSSIGLTNTSTQLISFYVLLMLINLLSNNTPKENANVDAGIWTKVEWNVGEIPEEEPPAIYIN